MCESLEMLDFVGCRQSPQKPCGPIEQKNACEKVRFQMLVLSGVKYCCKGSENHLLLHYEIYSKKILFVAYSEFLFLLVYPYIVNNELQMEEII